MKNSNYNQLRERINELVPELLILKFGCQLFDYERNSIVTITKNNNGFRFLENEDFETVIDSNYKILGKQPELSDVLRAMSKILNYSYQIRDTGEILIMGIPSETYYDLSKPLSEQSEETLQFLIDLLK